MAPLRIEMMDCTWSECLDVDECASGKNGDCQQKCVNNPVPVQQLIPTNGQNISLTCNEPGRPLAAGQDSDGFFPPVRLRSTARLPSVLVLLCPAQLPAHRLRL